jgi:myo-inositol-1(or 4)-monophosphatase
MDAAPDWLALCRRSSAGIAAMLAEHPSTAERALELGRGEGGDRTLMIDRAAEDIIFAELDALHAGGAQFDALSEERGHVAFGGGGTLLVIDPIDGSLNAKRGLPPHALSVAVADGPTVADVRFAYVYDFGTREEWTATAGAGATLNGAPLASPGDERRTDDGLLELVAIESSSPRWIAQSGPQLAAVAHRLRALGSIAIALCQVAAGRVDAMATLWRCRSVDAAAGALIVRESGALVAFPACEDPLGAPLDLAPHSPVVAALSARALADAARLPSSMP